MRRFLASGVSSAASRGRILLIEEGRIALDQPVALARPRARAADLETRYYTINVDGKKAGDYRLIIQRAADGALAVFAESDVRVTILGVPVYTYSYHAQEVWKAGRLRHFDSHGKEKGKDLNAFDEDHAAMQGDRAIRFRSC